MTSKTAPTLIAGQQDAAAYDETPEILIRPLLLFFALAAVLSVASGLAPVAYIATAIYALRGPRQTIEAFTVLAIILLGNRTVFGDVGAEWRWAVLFAGFGRAAWDAFFGAPMNAPKGLLYAILVFFLSTAVASGVAGEMPTLSALKLISFTTGIVTIFACFLRTTELRTYWASWFLTYFLFIIAGSVLTYLLGIGYMRTVRGFQGILAHPQLLGPVTCIVAAWIAGQLVSRERRTQLLIVALVATLALLFLSAARTAAVAMGGGLLLALPFWYFKRRRPIPVFHLLTRPATLILLVAGSLLVAYRAPTISSMAYDFVTKSDVEAQSASELFQESRGTLIAKSMANFERSPVVGIGFGVPSNYDEYRGVREGFLGIPVKASSEKGFGPTAIIEEVGIIGAILLLYILAMIALPILRHGGLPEIWTFWACLLTNVGAAIIFSIGGLGFFVWFMMGFVYSQSIATGSTVK